MGQGARCGRVCDVTVVGTRVCPLASPPLPLPAVCAWGGSGAYCRQPLVQLACLAIFPPGSQRWPGCPSRQTSRVEGWQARQAPGKREKAEGAELLPAPGTLLPWPEPPSPPLPSLTLRFIPPGLGLSESEAGAGVGVGGHSSVRGACSQFCYQCSARSRPQQIL